MEEIRIELAKISHRLKHLEDCSLDVKAKLEKIEDKAELTRLAVGKLEVKNGFLATALGAVSGFISSKFGGAL